MSLAGRTLFLVGGGTGGHLIPALILAEEVARRGGQPILLTGNRPVEEAILAGVEWERHPQRLEGSPLQVLLGAGRSLWRVWRLLTRRRPVAVVVLGGRVGLPAGLAAWVRRVPLFLVEINGVPGRTTRLLSHFARRIYIAGPATAKGLPPARSEITGVPLKRTFLPLPDRMRALEGLGWGGWRGRVLLVFGGSMGARDLNLAVLESLARPGVLPADIRVVHITGAAMVEKASRAWTEAGVEALVEPFVPDMAGPYAAADLVICRGGAMTVAEVGAAGCPALIVPYPWHKDRHQEINAAPLVARGQARILPQDRLAGELAARVAEFLQAGEAVRAAGEGTAVGAAAILEPIERWLTEYR